MFIAVKKILCMDKFNSHFMYYSICYAYAYIAIKGIDQSNNYMYTRGTGLLNYDGV